MATQFSQNATIESVFRPVLSSLARLVQQLRDGRDANGEADDLRVLLETLPLSSEQFALACNRLRNAQRYLQAQESGAAQWELNALEAQLRSRVDAETRVPRLRRQR